MADPNAPPPRDKTKDPRAVANIKKAMADPKIMEEVRRATREILEECGDAKPGEGDPAKPGKEDLTPAEMQAVRNTNLTCLQCKLDGTVPYVAKDKVYNLNELDIHLKSGYHSRASQLLRAFLIDYPDKKGTCALCDKKVTYTDFVDHLGEEHDEQFAD